MTSRASPIEGAAPDRPGRRIHPHGRRPGAGARRRLLAAARLRRRLGGVLARQGVRDDAARRRQQRRADRVERDLSRRFRRPAAQDGRCCAMATSRARGDVVVTRAGLEGGPVYALSSQLRDVTRTRPDDAVDRSAARHQSRMPDAQAVAASAETVARDFSAQGRVLESRDRAAARGAREGLPRDAETLAGAHQERAAHRRGRRRS